LAFLNCSLPSSFGWPTSRERSANRHHFSWRARTDTQYMKCIHRVCFHPLFIAPRCTWSHGPLGPTHASTCVCFSVYSPVSSRAILQHQWHCFLQCSVHTSAEQFIHYYLLCPRSAIHVVCKSLLAFCRQVSDCRMRAADLYMWGAVKSSSFICWTRWLGCLRQTWAVNFITLRDCSQKCTS